MKKLMLTFLCTVFYSLLFISYSQNVGIGTSGPTAKLQVKNGSVLFDGTTGSTPISGPGTRLMWVPAKYAFRVGRVNNTMWDDLSIGLGSFAAGDNVSAAGIGAVALGTSLTANGIYSFAAGSNVDATGNYSVSIGVSQSASGERSVALGDGNVAEASYSLAMGSMNYSPGQYAVALGQSNISLGQNSVSIGTANTAEGNFSIAIGDESEANGRNSMALGEENTAHGSNSTSMGYRTIANDYGSTVVGHFNQGGNSGGSSTTINGLNRIFEIGNGLASGLRSNAMTVLQNGNVGIGVLFPDQRLELDGNLTVQNGKGIIRSTDGTQQKKQVKIITINTTLLAGETKSFAFTWNEAFGAAPDAYVGAVAPGSVGGWAEVVTTVAADNTTGGTIWVFNPRNVTANPNFNIKIIGIGAQ